MRRGNTGRVAFHHGPKERAAKELERVVAVYCANEISISEILRRFRMGKPELERILAARGIPMRGRASKPKGFTTKRSAKNRPLTQGEILLERRAEEEARNLELYGADLGDVQYLRRKGFTINREGAGLRIGNQLTDFAELRRKAARERRLDAVNMPPAVLEAKRKGGKPLGRRKGVSK